MLTGSPRAAAAAATLCLAACSDAPFGLPEPRDGLCGATALVLAVGETAQPAGGAAGCLLAASAGAEYALAFVDTRDILAAVNGYEDSLPDASVTVSVAPSGAVQVPLSVVRLGQAGSSPPDFAYTGAGRHSLTAEWPTARLTPWRLDERFRLLHAFADTAETHRVVRIYGGRYVVAWPENGAAAALQPFLVQLDSAIPVVLATGLPLLQLAFAPDLPRTSVAANQYLIVLRDSLVRDQVPYGGFAFAAAEGETLLSWIHLRVSSYRSHIALAGLLMHEMAHTYQGMFMMASRPAGAYYEGLGAARWGVEGGADFMRYQLYRRLAALPLNPNIEWREVPALEPLYLYRSWTQPGSAGFTLGYANSMGFLRDQAIRSMLAGVAADHAVRDVARGAVEGWYGFSETGRRPGLAARMRGIQGGWWTPEQALLDWALSHAADDLTPNQWYQDRASYRVSDIPDGWTGWRPAARLAPSASVAATITRRHGSVDWVVLQDEGAGLAVTVTSDAQVAWKLIRLR